MAKTSKSKTKPRKKYHTKYNVTQLRRLTTLALNKQIAKIRLYTTQKELKQLPFLTLQPDPTPPPLQVDSQPPTPLQLEADLGQPSEEWLQQCFSTTDYTELIKPFYVYLYSLQITTRSRQKHSSRISSVMSLVLLSVTSM